MAYVRTKTIKGKTYRYLVKSVREGKRVRQVFVSYVGNPPPASGPIGHGAAADEAPPEAASWVDFTPLTHADLRVSYTVLLRQLGCQSVRFSLRAKHKHSETHARRLGATGEVIITKVCLHRNASVHAMAHEVGHVLDHLLQRPQEAGGSTHTDFLSPRRLGAQHLVPGVRYAVASAERRRRGA